MPTAWLSALLLGGALAMTCAVVGALIGASVSTASRFHPGRWKRWLRRAAVAALLATLGWLITAAVGFALPSSSNIVTGMALFVGFSAFTLGYRFVSWRRMLRALDSGIAVGLH